MPRRKLIKEWDKVKIRGQMSTIRREKIVEVNPVRQINVNKLLQAEKELKDAKDAYQIALAQDKQLGDAERRVKGAEQKNLEAQVAYLAFTQHITEEEARRRINEKIAAGRR
jgi:hypothetical protein